MPTLRDRMIGVVLVALLATAGCGGGGRPTGKVTWKEMPIVRAELLFAPKADPENVIFGVTGAGGTYVLDYGKRGGIPAGPCKVTITHTTLRNGKPIPDGEEGAALRGNADKVTRNQFEFDRDIGPGAVTLDFELNEGRKVGP